MVVSNFYGGYAIGRKVVTINVRVDFVHASKNLSRAIIRWPTTRLLQMLFSETDQNVPPLRLFARFSAISFCLDETTSPVDSARASLGAMSVSVNAP